MATVTIAANAAGGNRTVSVTVIPASGSAQTSSGAGNKNFLVQIPTKVIEIGQQPNLVTIDPTAAEITNGYGQTVTGGIRCGAYRNRGYILQDQNGDTITQSLTVTEVISNFTVNPQIGSAPPGNATITVNGTFWDLFFWGYTGNCPGPPPFTGGLHQKFKVDLGGGNVFPLSTKFEISASKNSSGVYSITATKTID